MLESVDYAKFFASFFIIVIFLYALYYYFINFTSFKGGKEGLIEIKERKIIGKNRFLYIMKVKNRLYFISSDDKGISVIDRWEES